MGTRSALIFKDDYDTIGVYRHWDGYTSGVIDDMVKFTKWNTRDDVSYMSANYIYFMKKISFDEVEKQPKKYKEYYQSNIQLGYGLINKIEEYTQSDLEYIHLIKPHGEDKVMIWSFEVLHIGKKEEGCMVKLCDDSFKLDEINLIDKQLGAIRQKKPKGTLNKQFTYKEVLAL